MIDFRNFEAQGIKLYRSEFPAEWIEKYIRNPSIIVEFGSYDGGDGAYYKSLFPSSRVVSVEADPLRFEVIKGYADKLHLEVYEGAICDTDGEVVFYPIIDPNVVDCETKAGGSGSINRRTEKYKSIFTHLREAEPIIVTSYTLEKFCIKYEIPFIDFLHLDVEGAEHRVIKGMGDLRPKVIWAESYLGKEYYGENAYEIGEIDYLLKLMGYTIVENNKSDSLFIYEQTTNV